MLKAYVGAAHMQFSTCIASNQGKRVDERTSEVLSRCICMCVVGAIEERVHCVEGRREMDDVLFLSRLPMNGWIFFATVAVAVVANRFTNVSKRQAISSRILPGFERCTCR